MNDFNELASDYERSLEKPDKKYSILPTILDLAVPLKERIISDLGCGSGFFAEAFLKEGAKRVYGIDNSEKQLKRAKQRKNITYLLQDIFTNQIPFSDIISAPFVINYANSACHLKQLLRNIYESLNKKGKLIGAIDLPNNSYNQKILKKRKKWGATKKILRVNANSLEFPIIEITLFDKSEEICKLHSSFISPSLLESILEQKGFQDIVWHNPIISQEGLNKFDMPFWQDYQKY